MIKNGTPDGDEISGTATADTINGLGGDDYLHGLGGNDVLNGGDGDDTLEGGAGADTLNGGTGTNWVDYFASAGGVTVNLDTGVASGGDAQGDVLHDIDNAFGSSVGGDHLTATRSGSFLDGFGGNDVLAGLDGNDWMNSGAGADHMSGGAGTDKVDYLGSQAGITITIGGGAGVGGDAQGDVIAADVEDINGTMANDSITGAGNANVLAGYSGNDVLSGMGGSDQLYGDIGDDVLRGGAGGDFLDGNVGNDTASYYGGTIGVAVNLATGTASGGEAQGDTLRAIENLSGSQGNDTLTGDDGANTLQGWNGNDALLGGAGTDILQGGAGRDTLTGGTGADHFVYSTISDSVVGTNADRITDFSHAQGDKIDLSAIDANWGVAGNQAFSFIGTGLFTHHAGELRYAVNGADTTIAGDVNGDGTSDFHITLSGHVVLAAGDFVL